MEVLPLVPRVPLQSPLAAQLLAFVVVHDRVALPPCVTDDGTAVSASVGAGVAGETVTVAVALPVPPGPVQVSTKFDVCVRAAVTCVPDVALAPDHAPDAVQVAALVVDQDSVDVPPDAICAGFAVSVTAGAGGAALTVTFAVRLMEPPGPVQPSV